MVIGSRFIAVVAVSGLSIAGVSCTPGSDDPSTPAQRASDPQDEAMEFELISDSHGQISAQVPQEPIASAPAGIPGGTIEVYALQRSGDSSLTLVLGFALEETAGGTVLTYELGAEGVGDQTLTGVTLFDADNLKRHLVYLDSEGDCLCSEVSIPIEPGESAAFAALFPAPPSDVTEMTVQTPLGSVAEVPITDG